LKSGVTTAQAASEMTRIAADLAREYPDDNLQHGLAVHSLGPLPFDGRSMIMRFAAVLFAFVSLILLIACTNVGAMVLARGVSRTREMALRLALGADRHHIVRLLVAESLLVTAGATTVALAGAGAGIRLLEPLMGMIQVRQIIAYDVALDWRVTAFAVMVAVVTSVICGLLPAVQAARVDLTAAMARDSGSTPRRLRTRQAFVVAQVAMSVVLVVCALLLGRSLRNANAIDPGFALDGIEVAGLDLRLGGYDVKTGPALADALMSRIQMLPGLESAAYARVVPLTRETEGGRVWLPDERGDDRAIAANWNFVTPDYFRTLRLPLVEGRTFDVRDRIGAPAVAIVNETFARRVWPGKDAVGQRLVVGLSRRPLEVVGVARDSKYRGFGESPTSFIYVPHAQRPETITWLLMRPTCPSLLPAVRALIAESNPNLPLLQAGALTEMAASGLFPHRVASWLAAVVAMIGVFLAAIGIYGLAAYNVGQRTREIGVRMALGALRSHVMRSVVGGAAVLAGIGAVLGVGAAALMTTLLAGMLYGVQPLDAASFVGGAAALAAVALVASLAPARRAASVNPVEALRAE
jgi:predicted permease